MGVFWIISGMANDDGDETMATVNIYIYIESKIIIKIIFEKKNYYFSYCCPRYLAFPL